MTDQLFKDSAAICVAERPKWCSNELWETISNAMGDGLRKFKFSFSRSERKIFRKRKPIPVSQWVEKHRVLSMSALPGVWRNEVTPYLVGIMDAAGLPFVHEINICATPQTGKTETGHNFVGYCIDRAPGPVMYIFPDEATGRENMDDRIIPMIQSSPRLRTHFTGKDRDKSSLRVRLQHMPIYIAWARSAARLANKPIRYAIADEIDKEGFSPGSSKEAHPLDLIDKRFNTYRSIYKFFKISSPSLEDGNIWQALQASDIIFEYHVKCPLCGGQQLMQFENIKWEGGSKADRAAIKNKHLAWYECDHCGGRWNDDLRNQAVRSGLWMVNGQALTMSAYLSLFRPASIGFQIPAWISYFVSLSECAASFLKGLEEGPMAMQDFCNGFKAEPYRPKIKTQEESEILAHRIDLPAGVVPKDTIALTAGIDVQKAGFWFMIKAWKKDLSSHRVQYGWVTTWEDINELIFNSRYPVENSKNSMGIWRAAIDTGGGAKGAEDDWSKTEEIYEWIRKNGRNVAFGIKGATHAQVKKVTPRVIDRMRRKNKPIPGGITLYFLDTAAFKEAFWWRMGRRFHADDEGPAETQHITMHADTGMDYVRQILAEEKQRDRKTGKIKWVPVRADNHLLDCFDPETEILTQAGWKFIQDVGKQDKCATVNLQTNFIEYQHPFKLIKREHFGEMVKIKGRRVDICVTQNHRMIVYKKRFTRKNGVGKHIFETTPTVVLAKDLSIWDRVKCTAEWEGINHKYKVIPASRKTDNESVIQPTRKINAVDWARFLGWYITEGHCIKINSMRRVFITKEKEDEQKEIAVLLDKLPYKWHLSGDRQFCITSKQLYDDLENCGHRAGEKKLPVWLKQASPEIIKEFLDVAIKCDGWTQGSFRTYSTISTQLADDMQELFFKIGFSANIAIRHENKCCINETVYEGQPLYLISECKTQAMSLRDGKNNPNFKNVSYRGMVYCVSVPNKTLICRRNGKGFIAGNCEVYSDACADPEWLPALSSLVRRKKKKKPAGGGERNGFVNSWR